MLDTIARGADRFLQFLEYRGILPNRFIAFGDSRSDFEMADELRRRDKQVNFVFVGNRDTLGNRQVNYPVEYFEGFSQGTLKFLKGLDNSHF